MIFVLKARKGKDKEILTDFVWDRLALHSGMIDCGMTPEDSFELPYVPGNLILSIQVDRELVAAIYADEPGLLIELKLFDPYMEELIQKYKAVNGCDFEFCSVPAMTKELRELAHYFDNEDSKKNPSEYEEKERRQTELFFRLGEVVILSQGLLVIPEDII